MQPAMSRHEINLGHDFFLRNCIRAVDIIVLNLYAFLCIGFTFNPDHEHNGAYLALNLAYIISTFSFPPVAQRRTADRFDILHSVTRMWISLTFFSVIFILFLNEDNIRYWQKGLVFFGAYFLVLLATRCAFHYFFVTRKRFYGQKHRCIFVGSNPRLNEVCTKLQNDRVYNYEIVGYFADTRPDGLLPGIPYLGTYQEMETWCDVHYMEIETVVCCLPIELTNVLHRIIDYCDDHVLRFYNVLQLPKFEKRRMQVGFFGDLPVMYPREMPLAQPGNRFKKRLFDIFFSLIVIIFVLSWVTPIVFIITELTMPGPLFFRQKRTGLEGNEFWCFKFRSMRVNKEADTLQATRDDPRTTRWGAIMRHLDLDELPQFINVLIGDMSVVGPRPHMLFHTEEYSHLIPKYMVRHFAKPGITGWAQVTGSRGETSELWQMEERIKKDIWYIEHWSMWLDVMIIGLTIWNVIAGKNKEAY